MYGYPRAVPLSPGRAAPDGGDVSYEDLGARLEKARRAPYASPCRPPDPIRYAAEPTRAPAAAAPAADRGEVEALYEQLQRVTQERDELRNRTRPTDGGESVRLSEQLRIAFAETAQLRERLRRAPDEGTLQEVADLRRDNQELKHRLGQAHTERMELRAQGDAWFAEKRELEREFDHELHEAEKEIVQAEGERDRAISERDRLESALRLAQADFEELTQQFTRLAARYAEATGAAAPAFGGPSRPAADGWGDSLDPLGPGAPANGPWGAAAPRRPGHPTAAANNPHVAKTDLVTGPVRGYGAYSPLRQRPGAEPPSPPRTLPPSGSPLAIGGPQPPGRPASAIRPSTATGRPGPFKGLEFFRLLGLDVAILDHAVDADEGIIEVRAVADGSLAERAGVRVEDRIDKINRHFIGDRAALVAELPKIPPQSTVRFGLMRRGIRKQALVNLP
jgi:hypothetical protein